MANALKPRAITEGATLSVVGLASSVKPDPYRAGVSFLEARGYRIVTPFDPSLYYARYDHLFACHSVGERLNALHDSFSRSEVEAVLSVRGGYGSAELLPHIDFKMLAANPKVFVGFSDVTALLVAAYQECGMVVFHAASPVTWGARYQQNDEVRSSVDALFDLLTGALQNPFENTRLTQVCGESESAEGILIGGNLSILASLTGTPWQPKLENHILFLEEVGEEPYRIHRMMMQMKLAGVLSGVRAVVLGTFSKCDPKQPDRPDLHAVMRDVFKGSEVPVFAGLPISHEDLNLPIPIGIPARISQNKLELLERSVL